MATQFQNRLVGTLVVAAAGIIFLPDILDGEKVSHQDTFIKMPPRPDYTPSQSEINFDKEALVASLPQEQAISDEVALDDGPINDSSKSEVADYPVETVEQSDSAIPVDAPELPTAVEDDVKPVTEQAVNGNAWVVQLGAFRQSERVDQLLRKLRSAGYVAFTRPIRTSSGTLTKVFVGPDLSRNKMEQALPELKRLTELDGKVLSFKVN